MADLSAVRNAEAQRVAGVQAPCAFDAKLPLAHRRVASSACLARPRPPVPVDSHATGQLAAVAAVAAAAAVAAVAVVAVVVVAGRTDDYYDAIGRRRLIAAAAIVGVHVFMQRRVSANYGFPICARFGLHDAHRHTRQHGSIASLFYCVVESCHFIFRFICKQPQSKF